MDNDTVLILTILICFFILTIIIIVLISNRRKEYTDFNADKAREISTGDFDERLKNLIDHWKVMEAVKLVRETKNVGLKEAKDYVNKFMRGEVPGGYVFEPEEEAPAPEELEEKVFELLVKKKKIEAVKLVKENLNIGLKEAKDYVEEIEKRLNL